MQLTVIAIGTRMPEWVTAGINSYLQRLPRHMRLQFREFAAPVRNKSMTASRCIEIESTAMLTGLDRSAYVIALDERGREMTSRQLATEMQGWMEQQPKVSFLIGGADGLSDSCRQRANLVWSLSRLTLPHALVRVLLVEQLYRAWSLLQGHPYHRD